MRRIPAALVILLAAPWSGLRAQAVEETLVPPGRARLSFLPSFASWDSRYGVGGEQELIGDDLADPTGSRVLPGVDRLEELIRGLTGNGFTGVAGASEGVIRHDVTRIDLGIDLGVTDWLTVGGRFPFVKNRTAVEWSFQADTLAGNLGLNPLVTNATAVNAFLERLDAAVLAAESRADALCGASPSGSGCASATALEERVRAFTTDSRAAYLAAPVFPMAGSDAALAMQAAAADLGGDLEAAGLGGLSTPMAFSTEWLTSESFGSLPSRGGSGIQGSSLGLIQGLWEPGDAELYALVRLAHGAVRDSGAAAPRFTYLLGAGALTRLGTGKVDAHDVFLDLPTGDGQMDVEGRLFAFLGIGSRLAIDASALYGVQGAFSLLRRVAPYQSVMPLASTLRAVRWEPGSYLALEVEPHLRLTPELSLIGSYRLFSKGADAYSVIGEDQEGSVPVEIADLEAGTEVTHHRLGLGLRYSTVDAWLGGSAGSPMELSARLVRSVAGSGGRTPVDTRLELGVRIFRGIWGDAPTR